MLSRLRSTFERRPYRINGKPAILGDVAQRNVPDRIGQSRHRFAMRFGIGCFIVGIGRVLVFVERIDFRFYVNLVEQAFEEFGFERHAGCK